MPGRDAIAHARLGLLIKYAHLMQAWAVKVLRRHLSVLRHCLVQPDMMLRQMADLGARLLLKHRIDSLFVARLPMAREPLPMVALALEIIDLRLELGDPRIRFRYWTQVKWSSQKR